MKKIKGILLFGILFLLGIGSSFAGISIGTSIDYYSENGGLTSYNFAPRATSQSTYGGFIYYNGNLFSDVVNYSPFFVKGGQPVSFNLSDYSLTSGLPRDYNLGYNNSTSSIYFDSDLNKLALWLYYDYYGTQVSRFFPLSNGFSSLSTSNLILGNGYYVRVFGDSSCLNTGTIISGSCSPDFVQVFTNSEYTYSSVGNYIDTEFNGINYVKGAIAPGVGKGYSFGFVSGSGWQNGIIDTTNGDFFDFRYIDFKGDTLESYKGVYLIRLDSSYSVDSSNYNVLALGITGNVNDFSLTYSIYNCPSNSSSISNCSFAFGGLTNYTGLNTTSLNTNTDFGKLLYLLTSPNSSRKISTSYNGNSINFFGDYYIVGQYRLDYTYNYNLSLASVSDLDIIGPIPDLGDISGNPFGIFGGDSLFYYCAVNHNTRDSPFCFNPDGTLKSDEELKNCYLKKYANLESGTGSTEFFCIDDRGIIQNIDIQLEGSGSVFVPCESNLCSFSSDFGSLGMTGYSSDFFDDYLNTTGYFFKCPWHYDNNLTIWPKLITLLNGVDILLPINCGIAGFQNGKNFLTFENSGHFIPNGPLLNFEGENRTLLFYFFDVIISIGIVIFVGKIFYLFHK